MLLTMLSSANFDRKESSTSKKDNLMGKSRTHLRLSLPCGVLRPIILGQFIQKIIIIP
jgi:hypothetical protein